MKLNILESCPFWLLAHFWFIINIWLGSSYDAMVIILLEKILLAGLYSCLIIWLSAAHGSVYIWTEMQIIATWASQGEQTNSRCQGQQWLPRASEAPLLHGSAMRLLIIHGQTQNLPTIVESSKSIPVLISNYFCRKNMMLEEEFKIPS